MSAKKAKIWPEKFLQAVPIGLTNDQFERKVKAPFLIMVLESTLETFDHKKFPDVKSAVDGSITLWKRDDIRNSDRLKAAKAAWAAWTAAAARPRVRAAKAEAEAAVTKYDLFADELLKLLENSEK